MGLDMYLTKHTYVKNWASMSPEERHQITVTKNGEETHIKPERISQIVEDIGYWRKANAIHRWFVENVQGGVDKCQLSYVERDRFIELLKLVNEVLDNPDKAKDLLPTQDGFFFGSIDYDKYYFEDLKLTKDILEQTLKESADEGMLFYQSSW